MSQMWQGLDVRVSAKENQDGAAIQRYVDWKGPMSLHKSDQRVCAVQKQKQNQSIQSSPQFRISETSACQCFEAKLNKMLH